MTVNTLEALFHQELKDIYSAEKQLAGALPWMIKAASSAALKDTLRGHLGVTELHVERLEKVFELIGQEPRLKKCKGMEGLLHEGKEIADSHMTPAVKDAGLIGATRRVEHYEIAAYGTLRTFAQTLGDLTAAHLLQQTLDEEEEADRRLTELAESAINMEAVAR